MSEDKLTITLTDRAPVTIVKDDWPIIASAEDEEWDGEFKSRAPTSSKWKLIVRQHADGRAIVYGIYSYSSSYQNARQYNVRGGDLLNADADLPRSIRYVGQWMSQQEHHRYGEMDDSYRWLAIINACIADLPAEELV